MSSISAYLQSVLKLVGHKVYRLFNVSAEERDRTFLINYVYRSVLERPADPDGFRYYMAALRKHKSFSQVVREIEGSSEAQSLQQTNEELVFSALELLFRNYGVAARDLELWKKRLNNDDLKQRAILRLIHEHVVQRREVGSDLPDPYLCWIMGTDRWLTLSSWREKASRLAPAGRKVASASRREHSGHYKVSAITSLYKGKRHIERFLKNITSQTIFDQSELIIVDADSPDGEDRVIADYQKVYPNIIYKRMNYCIGIYDAWNVAVQMARGKYLTSANVDDLRNHDSFERQAAALNRHKYADVVYQDFYYTFDPTLSFDEIASLQFKSELPVITAANLLAFNSPHNAPMWRRTLHDEVGLFDTSFKSAGDWEFWLRCLWRGKTFFKINTPHVAYFQNPEGMSTKRETKGIEEGRRIWMLYYRRLVSPLLFMSRQELNKRIITTSDCGFDASCYDILQSTLKSLGDRYKKKRTVDELS